jgi:predicted DsbA family dithiol-disulfide isomerase
MTDMTEKFAGVERNRESGGTRLVLHWFDFTCPFCYVGQHRTALLRRQGLDVVELPFQAHPEIPPEGVEVGPRKGAMYVVLAREAEEAGLTLNWPPRLPNSRLALTVAEWVRRKRPGAAIQLNHDLFEAHFALGEDLGDPSVIDRYASKFGVDLAALHAALDDRSAAGFVAESERMGRRAGVRGTPAWLVKARLIEGLLPVAEFERIAEDAIGSGV